MALASPSAVEDPQGRSLRRTRLQNALAAAILVTFFALAWTGRNPPAISGSDELHYWALSHSLEQGTYREIFQVGAPRAVQYPPAYPAWLLVLRAATGDHLDGVRAGNILFVALALVMMFAVVRGFAGGWLALAVMLVSAINPYLLGAAGSMNSEAMYVCMSTAALVAMLMAERSRRWAVPAVMVFALVAFLTRSAGITIVGAAGIWFLSRRPKSELLVFAVASTLVVGGWFSYTQLAPHEGAGSYARDLADAEGGVHSGVPAQFAVRAARSAVTLGTQTTAWTLALPTIEGTIVDNLASDLAIVMLVPLGLFLLWGAWRAVTAYLVLYGGLMLVWPYPTDRLLGVLVPFLLLAFLLGAQRLLSRFAPPARTVTLVVLIALMTLGNAQRTSDRLRASAHCDRSRAYAVSGCFDARTLGLINASDAFRARSGPNDVVVSSKAASVYFLTGRHTVPARSVAQFSPGAIVDTLRARKIRYLILTLYFDAEDGEIARAMLPRCHEIGVEGNYLPEALLVSVLPPGEQSDAACNAIPSLLRGFVESHPH